MYVLGPSISALHSTIMTKKNQYLDNKEPSMQHFSELRHFDNGQHDLVIKILDVQRNIKSINLRYNDNLTGLGQNR